MLDLDALTLDDFSVDPYPRYAALRETAPVAWLPKLGMWLVTREEDVRAILLDKDNFVGGTPDSLIYQTFGEQMLTSEGERHRHYRDARLQAGLMPKTIAERFGAAITKEVSSLIDGFAGAGEIDLRTAFAVRLPILVILDVFGFPREDEHRFRPWFDTFERALANHAHSAEVSATAATAIAEFHAYLQARIEAHRADPRKSSLLDDMLNRPAERQMSDDEIRRNAMIIFFGGISTVEALTLNTLWSLFAHPDALAAVRADTSLIVPAIDETMRWLSPVQSATRHTLKPVAYRGTLIPANAIVNCMLASANRDPAAHDDPDRFRIDRANPRHHLGFALGRHICLGQHLARAEAVGAVTQLLARLPELRLAEPVMPVGHEFRQPRRLPVRWLV